MDCLVTKLKGIVNDDTLMKLNEAKIKVTYLGTLSISGSSNYNANLYNDVDGNNITVRTYGKVSASPQTGGDIRLYNLSDGDILFISPKDVYTQLSLRATAKADGKKIFAIETEGILSNKLKEVSLKGFLPKEIKSLPKSTVNKIFALTLESAAFESIELPTMDVDINDIYDLYPNLDTIFITQAPIRLKNISSLKNFDLRELRAYSLRNIENGYSLNIEDFPNIEILDVSITLGGDYFSALNGAEHAVFCCCGTFAYNSQTFVGTKVGQMGGDYFYVTGNIDTLLQNLAANVTKIDGGNGSIRFNTPRTSASDGAVETLTSKGFNVSIPKQ